MRCDGFKRRTPQSRVFTIIVREDGTLILKPGFQDTVLAETQIGVNTKPWRLEEFMHKVEGHLHDAWQEMVRLRAAS